MATMSITSRLCPSANEVRGWKIGPSETVTSSGDGRLGNEGRVELAASEQGNGEAGREPERSGWLLWNEEGG
jgi:hypothetical protein